MRHLLTAAAIALATVAVALASAALPAVAQNADTLRIGLREDPDILDPTLGSSYVGRIVYAAMCDKLFDLDPKLNIVPQLATGYQYEDSTHLVIKLRSGVTFQDGEPLDADAAKASLMRHLTAKGSMRAGEINAIQSIDVVDPLTIRLVLKAPNSPLLAQLTDRAGMMLAPKAVESAGDKFGLHPVCAGPYAFDSRVQQDRIVLKRFAGYWNAKDFHFEQVIYLPMTNSSVRLANLQAGAVDLVEFIVPTDVPAVQKDPNLKLVLGDNLGYNGINFNVNNGDAAKTTIGQNALVRQAFELSLDRTAIIQVVYNGMFTPTAQANPQSSPYYIADVQPPPRDVAKAKALLKEAGVPTPVPVTLTITNNPDIVQTGEVIQSMAAEAGFDVKLKETEFASSLAAGYKGEFQAYMIGWSGRSDPDGNMWQLLHFGGTFNYGHWHNEKWDSLLDEARTITDVNKRRELYAQAWAVERQDMPLVYLWIARNIVGMKKNLMGFEQVPDGLIRIKGMQFAK
jgi:peptide/nickel transport system substrate-binding protein